MDTVAINSAPATAIADSDLVTVADSQGQLKPISFANLMSAIRGGIKIGGRNLLKNTGGLIWTSPSYGWLTNNLSLPKEELIGEVLTLSCKYRKTGTPTGTAQIGAVISSEWWDSVIIDINTAPSHGTIVKTFHQVNDRFSVFIASQPGFELYDFKLERGNMATDWSPAPEDSWGGVIVRYSNTYNSTEKGGAHDYRGIEQSARFDTDCLLSFGSLESACEFLGRACEDRSDSGRPGQPCKSGSERYKGQSNNLYIKSLSKHPYSGRGYDFPKLHFYGELLPYCTESRRWGRDILPNFHVFSLECLEENNIAERKEVAYADR